MNVDVQKQDPLCQKEKYNECERLLERHGGEINQFLQRWRRRALRNIKGENDLHFWDQSIARYRALPVKRPVFPLDNGLHRLEPAILSWCIEEQYI